ASLLAGVGLALSDARAKRRMQAATGDLEERNRHLAEANERLALLAHNLQIALGELERHQRRTAAVLTEEAAMGRAVANLAHTFQRPLVPLYNFLDKLESERAEFGVLGERYGKLIPEMVHRIDDLIRICRFVLAMPGKEVPQDLSEIAREVAALARRDAERLGRNVRVEVVSEPLPRIRASRTDLFFTLHELTTNAVRALASGGHVWIRMSAEPAEAPAHARLEVSDDGPGIDPDRLGRIFEPYHTTSRDESRGLGLYLVERAVARMGGEIRVSSAPGTGTLFVIRLPVGAESPPRTETS
ncbi:MAG: HAMP domain-containing histidine kinase, partial [Myxococcales bacterium]|nr:HAMP domain-containing histidine kinase [Myxococcales bacterium]